MNRINFIILDIIIIVFTLFYSPFFSGCVSVKYYLQEAQIEGPIYKTPVRTARAKDDYGLKVNSYLFVNRKKEIKANIGSHTKVNKHGIYEVEFVEEEDSSYFVEFKEVNKYTYKGNNLFWNFPSWNAGVGFDYPISNNFALTFGLNYSRLDGQDFFGTEFGFGYFYANEKWGLRTDFNFKYIDILHNVEYLKQVESSDDYYKIYFYSHNGKQRNLNQSISFTINTNKSDWKINYFFSVEPIRLILFKFKIEEKKYNSRKVVSKYFYKIAEFIFFTSGIYADFGKSTRLLAGVRITKEIFFKNKHRYLKPDLFIQLDMDVIKIFNKSGG